VETAEESIEQLVGKEHICASMFLRYLIAEGKCPLSE